MESNNVLEKSSALMSDMRSKGCEILHVGIQFSESHREIGSRTSGILAGILEAKTFTKDTWAAEFHPSMKPDMEKDTVVDGKLGLCAFYSTNLGFHLGQKGIKNVVLGGLLTNCCIESTMRTAYEQGYNVFTLKDCTAATSLAAHNATFENNFVLFSTVTNAAEVKAALAAGKV